MKLGRVVIASGAGYLLGSIPTGVMVGRMAAGIDVRKYGSRVSGATNVLRTAGPGAAAATFGLDTAKGYLAAQVGEGLAGDEGAVAAAVGAAVGHSWPVFAEFRGGRSVLTCWGSLLAIDPPAALAAAASGTATSAITRYVSLGALTGVGVATATSLFRAAGRPRKGPVFSLFALSFLVYRHQDNLARLRRGEEHSLGEQINAAQDGPLPAEAR
jgi:glycerol-3-phosphate acyltransferase PlsY